MMAKNTFLRKACRFSSPQIYLVQFVVGLVLCFQSLSRGKQTFWEYGTLESHWMLLFLAISWTKNCLGPFVSTLVVIMMELLRYRIKRYLLKKLFCSTLLISNWFVVCVDVLPVGGKLMKFVQFPVQELVAHLFLDWPLSQPLWSGPSWMISSDIHSLKTQRSL